MLEPPLLENKMCCDVTVRLAPPESLACITDTLRWTGRGGRSRVSGANAFMLLIQLLSGVIPACQFVWAADLHNEFILANVLHTLSSLLPSLSLQFLSILHSQCCNHSSPPPPHLSPLPLVHSTSPLCSPHPPLIKFTKCPESRVFKCKRASSSNWRHNPTIPRTQQPRVPLRGSDKRWMDGDDEEGEKVSDGNGRAAGRRSLWVSCVIGIPARE